MIQLKTLLILIVRALRRRAAKSPAKPAGRWEAVPDAPHPDDEKGGRFYRVRWSERDSMGRWLYVRHYGGNGTAWNRMAAEGDARRFNEQGRKPWEWTDWRVE
jgi:hypothetical protein